MKTPAAITQEAAIWATATDHRRRQKPELQAWSKHHHPPAPPANNSTRRNSPWPVSFIKRSIPTRPTPASSSASLPELNHTRPVWEAGTAGMNSSPRHPAITLAAACVAISGDHGCGLDVSQHNRSPPSTTSTPVSLDGLAPRRAQRDPIPGRWKNRGQNRAGQRKRRSHLHRRHKIRRRQRIGFHGRRGRDASQRRHTPLTESPA